MSELSEEEIIKILKHVIEPADIEHMSFYEIYENYVPLPKLNEAIQGLLDLYQKEKEKNEKTEELIREKIEETDEMIEGTYTDTTYFGESRRKICLEIKKYLQELLEERN